MGIPLLNDITIIFGLSIIVLFICHRLRVPTIIGFLLTGALAGPHGFGFINAVHEVEILAEVGVVLLLFTIGIEFSLEELWKIKRSVLLGGVLQVGLTILAAFVITKQLGQPIGNSIFIGFLISLSSTAIVLKILQERAEVDSPHGRTTLAVLIFQDVIIIPMMLFTPILAGATSPVASSPLILVAQGLGMVVLVMVSAKLIVPQVLHHIARTRSRELFLLSIVGICLAVAWLTSSMGLSLALGAFLAGLIVSESEYSHQAMSSILPFRDIFTSFFFVSIGMLFDISFLLQQPGRITLITLGVFMVKAIPASSATALLGFPLRTSLLVGLGISQVGEFSFILSKVGVEYGLLTGDIYQLFLAVSVLTMAATPFMIALAPRIADLIGRLPLPRKLKSGLYSMPGIESAGEELALEDHLIIIGFGINGRNVARGARISGIPYLILEMNPDTVRSEHAKGELIHYGDAVQEVVLEQAGIQRARVMVVAISDPVATRRITAIARNLNPNVHIVARTRFLQEIGPLVELGATEVIPEEFETSIEIITRILTKYLIPRQEIERFVAEIRADGYEMLRSLSIESAALSDLKLPLSDVEISTFRLDPLSPVVGKSLAQIALRKKYGVTVLAIRRDAEMVANPDAETTLQAEDILLILGPPEKMAGMTELFRHPEAGGNGS